MPRRSPEGANYRRYKKSGLPIESPPDNFSSQPDSSGTIGGRRGVQEYGIRGDISTEEIPPAHHYTIDPETMSEWSSENAFHEEEEIAKRETPQRTVRRRLRKNSSV